MTTLLVASAGGHLAQLHRLRPRLVDPDEDVVWVTFEGPQAQSLLERERVHYTRFVAQRDYRAVLRNAVEARSVFRRYRVDRVVSTGAGVALSFLPAAAFSGIRTEYVESSARVQGPSETGRVLARIPSIRLRTQWPAWADSRWRHDVSVFDGYAPRLHPEGRLRRVVVTLGTLSDWPFPRLVEAVRRALPADEVDVLWQLGGTPAPAGLPGRVVDFLPAAEMARACREADVVVSHSGVGSALMALSAGKVPVLVPRRAAWGEHVDDHQDQIAAVLARRGLALDCRVDALRPADLERAARLHVRDDVGTVGEAAYRVLADVSRPGAAVVAADRD